MTTTHVFRRVPCTSTRKGQCPVCGKWVTRRRTFEQTVNPFNRNSDGQVKTFDEVWEDVLQECERWQPDFTHAACRETPE